MPPSLCKKSLSRWSARGTDARRICRAGIGVDLLAAGGAPRLALGLERLPDHRRARIGARPDAEHPLAGAAVDRAPCGCPAARGTAGPACPRRRSGRTGGRSARRACRPGHSRPSAARLVEADIDAGDDLGRAADEPDVGRARSTCRSCRTTAGRDRAGWSRCRAGRRLRACGRSDRRSSDRPPGGCASGGRGIGRPFQSGALQPSQGRVSARQITRPRRSWI